MGLIDIFSSSTSDLTDSVEIDDMQGMFEAGASAAATGGAVAASGGAAGAAVLLPIAGKFLLEEGVKDYIKGTGKKGYKSLKEISEEYNDEEASQAYLGRACAGICKLANPLFEEDIDTLGKQPAQLNELIDRLFNEDGPSREELQKLETKFNVIIFGEDPAADVDLDFDPNDREAVIEELKEAFDTDDREEALALFQIYEQFLSDLTDDFTTSMSRDSATPAQLEAIEILRECTDRMRGRLDDFEDLYLRTELKNQGFDELTPRDLFDKYTFEEGTSDRSPIEVWKSGFKFPELVRTAEDGLPYYFERPLPIDHELTQETTEAKTVSGAIVKRLRIGEGKNLVLLGEPGMGKSHLCRLVATEWVHEGYGEVFYRKSGSSPFEHIGALEESIKKAKDSRGGHVLVVVEDATRNEAEPEIFDTLDDFELDSDVSVSFLLDSRIADWERYTNRRKKMREPPYQFLNEDSAYLEEYTVPDVTEADCEVAIEVFNTTTKGHYSDSAEALYEDVIAQETGRGEVLALIDTLIREGSFEDRPPLASRAREVHENIWEGNNDSNRRKINLDDDADRLYYEVVVGSMLLTAAEIGVHQSLLYALASNEKDIEYLELLLEGQSRRSDQLSEQVPYELDEVFLFSPQDNNEQYNTRHPTWATAFLLYHIEGESVNNITFYEVVIDVISKMAELADQPVFRGNLKRHFDNQKIDLTHLEQFEEDPQKAATRLLKELYRFSVRNDSVAPLFKKPETSGLFSGPTENASFEDSISTAAKAVPDECPEYLIYELLLIYAETIPNKGSIYNQQQEQREFLRKVKTHATETLEKQYQQQIIAETAKELAETSQSWDLKKTYYSEAINYYKEIDQLSKIGYIQQSLAAWAKDAPSIEWSEIEEYYTAAIETYRELDDLSQVGETQRWLASASEDDPSTEWSEVKEYYTAAIETYRELDDLSQVGETQRWLASAAAGASSTEWSEVKEYYIAAIATYRELDDLSQVGETQRWLASAAAGASSTEWSAVEEYYTAAIETYRELDDLSQVGETQESLAWAAKINPSSEWSEVEKYYTAAITTYRELGDLSQVGETQESLASAATHTPTTEWSEVEKYYTAAIATYRELGDLSRVGETQASLASAATHASTMGWSEIEEYYTAAIETFQELDDLYQVGEIQQSLASAAEDNQLTEWSNVEENYVAAIEYFQEFGDPIQAGKVRLHLAEAAKDAPSAEWSAVEEYYAASIETFQELGDLYRVGMTQKSLASSAASTSSTEWSAVEEYYTAAIETFKELGDLSQVGETQESLASAAASAPSTEWSDIEKYYTVAIETYRELDYLSQVGETQESLASSAASASSTEWSEVKEYYTAAIATYRELGDLSQVGETQESLASAAAGASSTEWSEVKEYYTAAIETFREMRDFRKAGGVQRDLAEAATNAPSKQWSEIKEYYEKSIEIFNKSGENISIIETKCSLAVNVVSMNELSWNRIRNIIDEALRDSCTCNPRSMFLNTKIKTILLVDTLDELVDDALAANDSESARRWFEMIAQEIGEIGRDDHHKQLEQIRSRIRDSR